MSDTDTDRPEGGHCCPVMISPADGRLVRDPDRGGVQIEAGHQVMWSSYWQRRLDDGDIVLGGEAPAAAAPQTSTAQKRASK